MKFTAITLFCVSCLLMGVSDTSAEMKPEDQWELKIDLNDDGIMDRLTSEPIRGFGTMGGNWEVFLGRNDGGEKRIGSLYAHPNAVRLEKDWRGPRIWVYLRSSGSSDGLGYYKLQGKKVEKIVDLKNIEKISELEQMEIFPGDGGTDLGRSICDTVFSEKDRCKPAKKLP